MFDVRGASVSVAISQTPCSASYATTGSDERVCVPGGFDSTVRFGSVPVCHVRPASIEVAQPVPDAAPFWTNRPTWNAATTVELQAKLSGSTAVSCWLPG